MRAAADDFRRSRLGPGPFRLREDNAGSETAGSGQVTIDTHTDSYEQAVAALRAAYGHGSGVKEPVSELPFWEVWVLRQGSFW